MKFNLRHLANIFEGLLKASPDTMKEREKCVRLWAHEGSRVYCVYCVYCVTVWWTRQTRRRRSV